MKVFRIEELPSAFCKFVEIISKMQGLNFPLSNVQMELMKLFSTGLSDKDLFELKKLLAKFYSDKAIQQADDIWDKKGLSDEDMDKWLNEKS